MRVYMYVCMRASHFFVFGCFFLLGLLARGRVDGETTCKHGSNSRMYVFSMYVCIYVCMYVSMYVCVYDRYVCVKAVHFFSFKCFFFGLGCKGEGGW